MKKSDHAYANARRLRKNLSLPEAMLWRLIKGKPRGVKFRKQHPIGRYVIDFYCAEVRTGFEIDGIAHDMGDRPLRDLQRSEFIAAQGISLVRIAASEVIRDPVRVAESIVEECLKRRA